MPDLSIDIETLGTKPGCPVLSIGAAFFFRREPTLHIPELDTFHQHIRLDGPQGGLAYSDGVSAGTLLWWLEQSDDARGKLVAGQQRSDALNVPATLSRFRDFCSKHGDEDLRVWGNGSTFDISILNELFDRAGIPRPWSFMNERDMRTIVDSGRARGLSKEDVVRQGVHHDARDDAIHQAKIIAHMRDHLETPS
jgi:exodeoxyribonuclease VIII